MHFLVISDIHANTEYLDKLDEEFKKADCVLFAGDFTNVNEYEKSKDILNKLLEKNDNLYAVVGNCDESEFTEELDKKGVSVAQSINYRDGLVFCGAGGALKFTGASPNERDEEDLLGDLCVIENQAQEYGDWQNLILIVHQPPKDTKLDKITAGIHVGSQGFREFIEKYQPLVSISGHVHESFAIDTIGRTTLINPGSLAEGKYALLEVQKQNGEWKVVKAELKDLQNN